MDIGAGLLLSMNDFPHFVSFVGGWGLMINTAERERLSNNK